MKTFNKPYLNVINLGQKEDVTTGCVVDCKCDIDTCTCNMVCECVGNCVIVIPTSN